MRSMHEIKLDLEKGFIDSDIFITNICKTLYELSESEAEELADIFSSMFSSPGSDDYWRDSVRNFYQKKLGKESSIPSPIPSQDVFKILIDLITMFNEEFKYSSPKYLLFCMGCLTILVSMKRNGRCGKKLLKKHHLEQIINFVILDILHI